MKTTRIETIDTRTQTTTHTGAFSAGVGTVSAGVAETKQGVATASLGGDATNTTDTTLRPSVEKEVGRDELRIR